MADKKFLDANGLKLVKNDYNGKIDKKVDKEEGKVLSTNDYTAEDKAKVDGAVQSDALDTKLGNYVTTETADSTYLKSAEAETTYVKSEGFDDKVKGLVGSVYRPKGSLANLEAIKAVETPTEGDVYNATDSGANYVYVGEGQGDDESGWDKLSETVDLSGYETTASVTEKLAKKADSTTVTEGLAGKADKTELPEAIPDDEIQQILSATE